jgi:hypothetical protein
MRDAVREMKALIVDAATRAAAREPR